MENNKFKEIFDKYSDKFGKVGATLIALLAFILLIIKFIVLKVTPASEIELNKYRCNDKNKSHTEIYIQLDGAVNKPGVYKVKTGTVLVDIVNEADGLTEDADVSNIDLTLSLEEDTKIVIPFMLKSKTNFASSSSQVNINTATLEELIAIKGIGKKYAVNIIQYRNNKRIESIDDLIAVKGIGVKKAEKIITQIGF